LTLSTRIRTIPSVSRTCRSGWDDCSNRGSKVRMCHRV